MNFFRLENCMKSVNPWLISLKSFSNRHTDAKHFITPAVHW